MTDRVVMLNGCLLLIGIDEILVREREMKHRVLSECFYFQVFIGRAFHEMVRVATSSVANKVRCTIHGCGVPCNLHCTLYATLHVGCPWLG